MSKKTGKNSKLNLIVGIAAIVFIAIAVITYKPHSVLDDIEITPAPAPVATEAPTPEPVATPEPTPWRENLLDGISLSKEEKRVVYDEIQTGLDKLANSDGFYDLSFEQQDEKSVEVIADVGAKHGISQEDADNIYSYGTMGYLYDFDPSTLTVKFGDFQSGIINGTTLIVKAKISPSYNNEATINQNYFNVEDLVQKQGCDTFSEIQYWAVADMTDGSESKVIMFTAGKDLISAIASGRFAANQMGNYVTDLWILPSLLQ